MALTAAIFQLFVKNATFNVAQARNIDAASGDAAISILNLVNMTLYAELE